MILKIFIWLFKRNGWKAEGIGIPAGIKKAVIIAMPHTSNWDFVYAMAAIKIFGINLNYLAKKELFRWPIKKVFVSTGGIPVERKKNTELIVEKILIISLKIITYQKENYRIQNTVKTSKYVIGCL